MLEMTDVTSHFSPECSANIIPQTLCGKTNRIAVIRNIDKVYFMTYSLESSANIVSQTLCDKTNRPAVIRTIR